ncbi:MAG TPA: hypothetical protein DHM90_15065 [Clostridiaceae bacterium]|nr:hypothetical protein [Clostridiaceae bacterium]
MSIMCLLIILGQKQRILSIKQKTAPSDPGTTGPAVAVTSVGDGLYYGMGMISLVAAGFLTGKGKKKTA